MLCVCVCACVCVFVHGYQHAPNAGDGCAWGQVARTSLACVRARAWAHRCVRRRISVCECVCARAAAPAQAVAEAREREAGRLEEERAAAVQRATECNP